MTLKVNDPYDFQQLGQTNKDEIKRNKLLLEQLLIEDGVKQIPDRGKFLCPYHNDRNPSAEIRELPSGYYFICYACDLHLDYFALTAFRENIPLREAFKKAGGSLDDAVNYLSAGSHPPRATFATVDELAANYLQAHPNHSIEELNRYDDPAVGTCTFATVRVQVPGQGKLILPASFTSQNGWEFKAPSGLRPLYNLARVREVENVLVVEGEKCVNRFTELNIEGWAATTSSGGGKAVDRSKWDELVGKNVYIWRDYDKPGERYQNDVISCLRALGPVTIGINIVNLNRVTDWWPTVQEGDDLADYLQDLDADADRESYVLHLLHNALEWDPSMAFGEHLVSIAEGRYQLVEFPTLPVFSTLTQAGLPGKSTMFIGNPGSAKSWLAMELGWTLNEVNVPTATLFLEDGQVDYQKRCLAQMLGRSEYVSGTWQEANPALSQELFTSARPRLNSYFQHVTCLEAKLWSPDTVLDWMSDRANEGYRVIIVDPVTAMEMTNKQWMTDQKFVLGMQSIITDSGMSGIFTTHQKTGVKHAGIDGAAGGQSWSRFTHTNAWLQHVEGKKPLLSRVGEANGSQQVVEHKRQLFITKARNGSGDWQRIAVDLDPGTLRVTEYGVMLGEVKPGEAIIHTENAPF